ncbi:MAG TPA: hypothetical protein PKW33_01945 [Anaerolineaceae bacterium]|nr:hypothetical protein [Anaerolineaceae bacterium]HPN50321.1 hypothetical protein [Anaerolineaceae bacterium]
MKTQFSSETEKQIRARIVTAACLCLSLVVIAVIGGWAVTGTLTDWETVAGGVIFIAILAGLAVLARRKYPEWAAGILAGLLFLMVSADVAYYGLGSPSAMAFLLPVMLTACIFGSKPGLAAAALAAGVVFCVAWASLNGSLAVAAPVDISHLSYNAPVISVILLFCGGVSGYAVELWRRDRCGAG